MNLTTSNLDYIAFKVLIYLKTSNLDYFTVSHFSNVGNTNSNYPHYHCQVEALHKPNNVISINHNVCNNIIVFSLDRY